MSGIKKEIDVLREALKADESYYMSWQANIAVAFQDEFDRALQTPLGKSAPELLTAREYIHDISNKAAKNFLDLLIRT